MLKLEREFAASKTCEGSYISFHKSIPFTNNEYWYELMVEEVAS